MGFLAEGNNEHFFCYEREANEVAKEAMRPFAAQCFHASTREYTNLHLTDFSKAICWRFLTLCVISLHARVFSTAVIQLTWSAKIAKITKRDEPASAGSQGKKSEPSTTNNDKNIQNSRNKCFASLDEAVIKGEHKIIYSRKIKAPR